MEIIKIKTDSIAHLSYLIISDSQAAVIDPMRDSQQYMDILKKKGAKLSYIFETHRNEDFVTGSRELKRFCNAEIYHGKGLDFQFGESVSDEQAFELGKATLKVLATPGHTPESISIALFPENDSQKAIGVFTGDALFVDDVGRTDFFPDKEKYATQLYESIHNKILPLGDQVVLYPAHGAGSVCGGGISDREVSTLGFEKAHNPMLQLSKEKFINTKVNENHQYPPYFKKMEELNLTGEDAPLINYKTINFISVKDLKEGFDKYQVVDIREAESFLGCSIPKSISIPAGMEGAYLGYFMNYEDPICLIAEDYQSAEAYAKELRRLGYDNELVQLSGGVTAWEVAGQDIQSLQIHTVQQIKQLVDQKEAPLLDVRKPSEWEAGIIDNAQKVFLGDIPAKIDDLKNKPVITYCGSGKRATIAASLIARAGNKNVSVFVGSYKAWKNH